MLMKRLRQAKGFTLIELVIVIVIMAIIATVAVRQMGDSIDDARYQATMDEMTQIAHAVAGNPSLHTNGARANFGYVGDVGDLPPNLTALAVNPGYATWDGPYIELGPNGDDYSRDAWEQAYSFNGISIRSTGSGSPLDRVIVDASDDLLANSVTGYVVDARGISPTSDYIDSLALQLRYPNGSGGHTIAATSVSTDGSFTFGSVPIGNHELYAIWLPTSDTMTYEVSVPPSSVVHLEVIFPAAMW